MSDNEDMVRNDNAPSPGAIAANQGKEFTKKQAKKVVKRVAGNAVKSWLVPLMPWILGILLALIIIAGIIMFFLNGVGLVFDSIKLAIDDFGHKVQAWWYGGEQYVVSDQEIIDVADALESMGYDLKANGFLTDDVPEIEKVASGLDRSVSVNDVWIDESGIARDSSGITNIKSDYIRQYIVSSNYMYTLYYQNRTRFGLSGFIRLYNDLGTIGNKGKPYYAPNGILDAISSIFEFGIPDSNIQIRINTQDKTLEISHVEGVFWWKKVNTFKYNLEGWTGRYGMPLEFLLSVHLASMQPDLAYEMTTEFPTNVNMLLHPVKSEIIGHIHIDGDDITLDNMPSAEEWYERQNIHPDEEGDESGGSSGEDNSEPAPTPEPNGYDLHDRDSVIDALEAVYNEFDMYFPYIGDVTDHWFRNAYLTIGDYNLRYVKNDQEFEYYTGERWTEYETDTDEDGNEYYVLYVVKEDGSLGERYNGTVEQAEKDGYRLSKKAKTGTIKERKSDEFIGSYWTAYKKIDNAVLISGAPLTPDVVGGRGKYNSIPYHDEITYDATTHDILTQVRDGERGETNAKIKKMLTQYYYYSYNGQADRADDIREDKAKESVKNYKHEDASGNILDGTNDDPRNKNLITKFSINADSLSAFKILENMNTVDADEIYRDFKELIVELNYFDKEYFAGNQTDVFQWPIPDCGTAGWPVREIEKPVNTYGTLIDSKVNLLNLKNLFLQYRQEDEENEEPERDNSGRQVTNPNPTSNSDGSDGATTGDGGGSVVDNDGYTTPEGEAQIEREEREKRERREREGYVPGQSDNNDDAGQEGTQGQSEGRNAGGGTENPNIVTEDFIKAEDESGNPGWIDTYDIVMDNLGYNHAHPGYGSSERDYMNFMRGLGGVFAEYAGEENNGEGTFEDFVAACQFVYGLATMYGFEYCNGNPIKCDPYQLSYFGTADNSPNDAYHQSGVGKDHKPLYQKSADKCTGCHYRHIDDTMIEHRYCTNCNYTTDKVFYKAGLFDHGDMSCSWGSLIRKYNGNYVYRTEDLQIGDLIEHFDGGGWVHVSFVGEINDDEIVVYETGHGWTNKGDFRFVYNRYTDPPTGHDSWFGVHLFDLEPRNRDEYEGYDGNVDVVSPITGEVIDAGEISITNIQTNEVETVGFIKIRALVAGDIGTCIPDTDIKNMEDPDTKVPKLKEGTSAEKLEYKFGGYKLFLQEYQNAKVNGFVLYMEGFDLRLFEKDEAGNIKLKSRRGSRIN